MTLLVVSPFASKAWCPVIPSQDVPWMALITAWRNSLAPARSPELAGVCAPLASAVLIARIRMFAQSYADALYPFSGSVKVDINFARKAAADGVTVVSTTAIVP